MLTDEQIALSADVQRLFRRFQYSVGNEPTIVIMAALATAILAAIDDPRAPRPTPQMSACVGPLRSLIQSIGLQAGELYKNNPPLPFNRGH